MPACPRCGRPDVSDHRCLGFDTIVDLGPDPRLGKRMGRYLLEARASDGILANVYRATDGKTRAAVKIYSPAIHGETTRVFSELEAQRSVNHPHVARLLEWGEIPGGEIYIASEWVEGQLLEDRLKQGPMDWREALSLVRGLAEGLRAIHAAGIVHRDLKPANIVLPSDGKTPAKILDFGHALVLNRDRVTEAGFTVGTAAYMAPEQAAGKPLDGRADFYALGVVLYRCLTGHLPFEHSSVAEILRMHQRDPVVPPRARAPGRTIPSSMEDLTLWLLAKTPEARVPSARVLLVTLKCIDGSTRPNSAAAPAGG